MVQVAAGKEVELARVSEITENLIAGESFYQEKLDREEMREHMIELFDEFSTAELKAIGDEYLKDRIDSILILHAVSGTLNDLTPEQLEIFDAAVENR
ncbi:MAG: hypothetical protein GDA56_25795 [Hormoscilla sp. GM7CHS1pb]|nr:hypothetical protein [Hormoscilla sp. GM7CHS1pb]